VNRVRTIGAVVASGAAIMLALSPMASAASTPTASTFRSGDPITVLQGESWELVVDVTSGDGTAIGPTDGTVDFYLSGQGEAYITGLAVQPGGVAYITPTTAQPQLEPGSYDATAAFIPAAGSTFAASSTAVVSITVIARDAYVLVEITVDAAVYTHPHARVALEGTYIEQSGVPAGTWTFTVTEGTSLMGPVVFTAEVAQDAGSGPVELDIEGALENTGFYHLESNFVPADPSVFDGVDARVRPYSSFSIPEGFYESASPAQPAAVFENPVGYAVAALAGALLVLVVVAVIVAIRRRRIPRVSVDDPAQ